ncbi:hypothetical protein KSP39_PZI021051 [Platanthera zijinensis]|uniref:Uncharacterized protein n=1 Tax=Platanthera zijinensis TaxID=2320716 RepID=A0AAP0AXZ7_9ASPA
MAGKGEPDIVAGHESRQVRLPESDFVGNCAHQRRSLLLLATINQASSTQPPGQCLLISSLLLSSRVSVRLRHAAAFPKTPFLSIRHVPRPTLLTALPCRWPRRYFPDSSPPPSPTPELMAEPAKRWVPLEANPDVMNQVSLPL